MCIRSPCSLLSSRRKQGAHWGDRQTSFLSEITKKGITKKYSIIWFFLNNIDTNTFLLDIWIGKKTKTKTKKKRLLGICWDLWSLNSNHRQHWCILKIWGELDINFFYIKYPQGIENIPAKRLKNKNTETLHYFKNFLSSFISGMKKLQLNKFQWLVLSLKETQWHSADRWSMKFLYDIRQ